ncbi:MAG: amidohydrolase family protein [Deltaproteobacteria bacterium]|nr:amidohydrolase family protein [Deltaproteobacteria bacterium]MBW2390964.1 amidohydrolase family protein [Deltaproteobacteria bacterium]
MTHVTHLFNAMGPLHHREPGVAGWALADDRVSCDLICDGVHLHPAMVRTACRAKGDRLLLITDRVQPPEPSAPEGSSFGSGSIHDDGSAFRLPDGTLAGSNLSLDRALRNAQAFGAMTRLEAIAASTLRPARLLGIESERGTLRVRARADFAILDDEDRVQETWIAGERVFAGDF